MRDLVLLTSLIFLLFSCQNEENIEEKNIEKPKIDKTEVTTIEDLPEGEWNGEYIKIVDEAELKPRKKSLGSDFFSMGKLKIDMEEDVIEFDLFERKKNILTFTNASITAFIRSAFNEDVHLYFKKNNIVTHHKGKYKVDPSGEANNSVRMVIQSEKDGQSISYQMETGEVEILNFSPRLGTLEATIKGTFSNAKGEKQKGEGTLKMNFEGATMTIN